MKNLVIEVTREDILCGVREDCHLCPIARAIARRLNLNPSSVHVGGLSVMLYCPYAYKLTYRLSEEAIKFICDFDRGLEVQPATFTLEAM